MHENELVPSMSYLMDQLANARSVAVLAILRLMYQIVENSTQRVKDEDLSIVLVQLLFVIVLNGEHLSIGKLKCVQLFTCIGGELTGFVTDEKVAWNREWRIDRQASRTHSLRSLKVLRLRGEHSSMLGTRSNSFEM